MRGAWEEENGPNSQKMRCTDVPLVAGQHGARGHREHAEHAGVGQEQVVGELDLLRVDAGGLGGKIVRIR